MAPQKKFLLKEVYSINKGSSGGIIFVSNKVEEDNLPSFIDPLVFCTFLKSIEQSDLIGDFFVKLCQEHLILNQILAENNKKITEHFALMEE